MNTAERFQQPGRDEEQTEAGQREVERPQARSRTRTTRRFEFGFFIRKIKNGQVVYYKRFPSYGRQAIVAPVHEEESVSKMSTRSLSAPAASGLSSASDEPVMQPTSGSTDPSSTPGPVGGASATTEVGFFLTSVTETEDDEES